MKKIEIVQYNNEFKKQWDDFILNSRVDSFLFYRDYIDYHSDRFIDKSFLFYLNGKLECLLPGNINGSTFYSHQGLTFGGMIPSARIKALEIFELFTTLALNLKNDGIDTVIYKPQPWIYHKIPSQEDIYALYRLKAEKIGCNLSSTIFQNNKLSFTESRKSGIRKCRNYGLIIEESNDVENFWNLLNLNLTNKYSIKPVHSVSELIYLKSLFPDNIKLIIARINKEIVAGCILYLTDSIAHVQYIASNPEGRKIGALDFLFNDLINERYHYVPIFDFGHSNLQMGEYLNENLIFQKEGFGGRGVVYEIYKVRL